jgi:guanosine-3',5'-bis(diphosphate) 3'-pyrophosphohydrolase
VERLGDIIEKIREYYPEADISLVERAYVYSAKVHTGQLRKSGEPYLMHPLAVASILADFRMDTTTIAAGLLHDTLEDTPTTEEDLRRLFGEDVLNLVLGVTKISKMAFGSTIEKEAANYRKMVLAMADDIRVILIKLADRLHNLRTLEHLAPAKRKRVARETLEVYAPLAHRLGMGGVKIEMEDLAFRHMEPEVYEEIRLAVAKKRKERETYIEAVRGTVVAKLAEAGVRAEVLGRAKHFWSIHQKMLKQKIGFDEVYDLIALRVVTDTLKDCYGALGIIHSLWKPVPGRFKDYIAMPKENLYQSLHTTIIGPEGERVEFQIRTRDMNRVAEAGIAAHWKYKEAVRDIGQEEQFGWLRQTLDWMKDTKDPQELVKSFKMELFPDEVSVFTPKGDVRSFPRGATPVDFAYAIHTEVGHRCVGAKVNGRLVPLRYQMRNGDRIEIMTSPGHHPSKDWLKFVATSRARAKITYWLKQEQRERSVGLGRDMLDKELRRYGASPAKIQKTEEMAALLESMGYKSYEELLAAIGRSKVSAVAVARKVLPPGTVGKEPPKEGAIEKIARSIGLGRDRGTIKVAGLDDVLIRFSKCCNPVPGDKIVGFITRGRGISVHTADCPNVAHDMLEAARRIDVEWDTGQGGAYPARLVVEGEDRSGMLADISECIAKEGAGITAANVRVDDRKAYSDFEMAIGDLEQLNRIIHAIRRVKGVTSVHRQKILQQVRKEA